MLCLTCAMWIKDMQKLRYALLIPNILITIYALIFKVYTTALLDFMEVVIIVVAILTFQIKKKKEFNKNLL